MNNKYKNLEKIDYKKKIIIKKQTKNQKINKVMNDYNVSFLVKMASKFSNHKDKIIRISKK